MQDSQFLIAFTFHFLFVQFEFVASVIRDKIAVVRFSISLLVSKEESSIVGT